MVRLCGLAQVMNVDCDESAPPYDYQPLLTARQIRLLRVTPSGDEQRQLCYDITVVDLDDDPSYNALSYTWGCPFANDDKGEEQDWPTTQSQVILRDGKHLKVGHNLFRALTCFGDLGVNGSLWIDAICINQNDV